MSNKEVVINLINEKFSTIIWDENAETTFAVPREDLLGVCSLLRENEFEFLADVTAVDYIKDGNFRVIYQIGTFVDATLFTVKVDIPREDPTIENICALSDSANWLEREVYDFFGIQFANHPNLKRILMWEGYEGYPLRRDYVHVPSRFQGRREME